MFIREMAYIRINKLGLMVTLKAYITTALGDILKKNYFSKKIRFDISCDIVCKQTIHMKYHTLFS